MVNHMLVFLIGRADLNILALDLNVLPEVGSERSSDGVEVTLHLGELLPNTDHNTRQWSRFFFWCLNNKNMDSFNHFCMTATENSLK